MGPTHMIPLQAARLALAALQADPETPARVLEAAQQVVSLAERNMSIPAYLQAVLLAHAATRQQQDRYGK